VGFFETYTLSGVGKLESLEPGPHPRGTLITAISVKKPLMLRSGKVLVCLLL
jgi:hypothetical protein